MVIRDVLYGDINIEDEIIEALIRTKEMQRLRGIKQLGLSYLIFPGAEHSRYTHSIGVYYLATQIVEVLEQKSGMRFDEYEKKGLYVACLLHDLGHGPYSHASEYFFAYDHEQMTVDIIEHETTQINGILKDQKYYEDVTMFIRKIHPNKLLNSILSSSIDADRMDYLVRDSYYCGVSYGKFDLQRLLKIIDTEDDKIVFLEKGVHTIEDFLMSRYHMFNQVYLNDKSSGYELLVAEILKRISELHEEDYKFKADLASLLSFYDTEEIDVKDFIELDDMRLYHIIAELRNNESDEKLFKLCSALLDHEKLVIDHLEDCLYTWEMNDYTKRVYDGQEPVYIKMKNGKIKKLEEVSPLVAMFKSNLKISVSGKTYGIRK
ncbi:HD domain-containing protein [Mollicutes bacterium LVI A0039]|nr:HD domain-containing protein [Mollicutes bacterium LVI A0039]